MLKGAPGFTISTDMQQARLFVRLGGDTEVVNVSVSDGSVLQARVLPRGSSTDAVIHINGLQRGRSRVQVLLSDGTQAVAHYLVLPPFPTQVQRLTDHWCNVAWLPREYSVRCAWPCIFVFLNTILLLCVD